MTNIDKYDLTDFTPYLLNVAAEATSMAFQDHYKSRYGMLRTEWRVMFHLGQYGPMLARDICTRARVHKTKVSRAVAALEKKRYLQRQEDDEDRRQERLSLTKSGAAVFRDLRQAAWSFEQDLMSEFSDTEREVLKSCLTRMAGLPLRAGET